MIDFQKLMPEDKASYDRAFWQTPNESCAYSFANLFCWGSQRMAWVHGCAVLFSCFGGYVMYPYPLGDGDRRAAVEAILADAGERGIPCRIGGMSQAEARELEENFPGRFHIRPYRDGFEYVYAIEDLAELKGRKFQKKRNHINRFLQEHPDYTVEPLDESNMAAAREMVANWYIRRKAEDPQGDYLMESVAINRAMRNFRALGMEGIVLKDGDTILAVTMGSPLAGNGFDIHYEKAMAESDGVYTMVNREFARYLREKYPHVMYLNREDDMGLEGLRKAKLSYHPHHMVEKYAATLEEEDAEDQ